MKQKYAEILSDAISYSGLKLEKIADLVGEITGTRPSREYISRLQNGKNKPASDQLNDALAQILKIDPIELKAAAYREKIPPEVLKILQQDRQAQPA